MDRFYTIYRITGPNGRCYIGLTKFTAEQRFRQHMAFAFRKRGNHPFYDTVLAYGPDAFAVEAIACAVDADSAGVTEQRCIAQVPKPLSLNVSPGGECDAEAASAVFWKAMRAGLRAWWATLKADPERYAEYLATRTASLKRTLKNGS